MQGKSSLFAKPPIIRIAVYGGTFSPIHHAHVKVACHLQDTFRFDEFKFLPNKAPVIDKTASAGVDARLAMLRLALEPYSQFSIDEREVRRVEDSFMYLTLESLHAERENIAITLIIGMDSFLGFHRWREWKKIVSLCNLIVMERPGCECKIPDALQECLVTGEICQLHTPEEVLTGKPGGFYICNAGDYDISAVKLRESLKTPSAEGDAFLAESLPVNVLRYIKKHELFGYHRPTGTSVSQ